MSKCIVFCADGTWSGPGEPDVDPKTAPPTNVFKLFCNLDGRDTPDTTLLEKEQERVLSAPDGTTQQHAKYLNGVGDSDNFLVKALGGAFGAGLIVRIVRGYTFISRNFEPGDKIFIVGFSRGAYTARALAGFIAAKGLLDASKLPLQDKVGAYRFGAAVWYEYLHSKLVTNPDLLARLEELVLDLPSFLSSTPQAGQLVQTPIEAVAVWDTVGALGIPEYAVKAGRLDAFQFADLKLSTEVAKGRHAVAIDERRVDFTPTLWDADERIAQLLFVGGHGDVGGGYPQTNEEAALSDGTLAWMTGELEGFGVRFSASPFFKPEPDAKGPAHCPWAHSPWEFLPSAARQFPAGLYLSESVVDRLVAGNVIADFGFGTGAPYQPQNLTGYIVGKLAALGVKVVA
jgi:uncharacterized protein (DUF2235 family)